MNSLYSEMGSEVDDIDEEVFDLFSHVHSSRDLGMIDPKAEELDITILDKTFTIKQNSGILQSQRRGGTTGAAVWECSVRLAEWLATPSNPLFEHGYLDKQSVVLELGTGVAGMSAVVLSRHCHRYIATDQPYILKLLQENIEANRERSPRRTSNRKGEVRKSTASNIETVALDWETDDITSFLHAHHITDGVDAVVACDCIYNYALIQPLVDACADICRVRQPARGCPDGESARGRQTVCIIAQQLRQPTVFEQWLQIFAKAFHIWRVPNEMATDGLKEGSGFVIHVGILKQG